MHEEQNSHSKDDLDTTEIHKVAEIEASIEVRLTNAKENAAKIITSAREEAEEVIEEARQEAALLKTKEIERIRQEEIEKSKLIIKNTEKINEQIIGQDTDKVSKKLFEEFLKIIAREA